MKNTLRAFIFLSLLITSHAMALTGRQAWKATNMAGKVELLREYRNFFQEHKEELATDATVSKFLNLLISEAWAGNMDCLYAGWPSKRVGGKCSSPAVHNPDYKSNCGKNQLQCQPLLFGKGVCVQTETQEQRNSAFANCEKNQKRSLEEIVREIKKDGKEEDLLALFDTADGICRESKTIPTMCKRVSAKIEKMKPFVDAANRSIGSLELASKDSGMKSKGIPASQIAGVVTGVEKVNLGVNNPADCEPVKVGEDFDRLEPRAEEKVYTTNRPGKDPAWNDDFYAVGSGELRYSGFTLSNIGPNAIAGTPLDPNEAVERTWNFVSEDSSQKETYLWITDDAGSGFLSQRMESVIVLIPRKMKPSVEVVGDELHVTLTTGEKVIYDKETKLIKGGVIKEGKVDLNPDRFSRKFAPITYSGSGVSIRVDKRGEDPRLYGGNATITQNGKSCKVPATDLWNSAPDFKFADDGKLLELINRKCQKKFSL